MQLRFQLGTAYRSGPYSASSAASAGSENSDHILSGNSGHPPVALPGQKIVGDSVSGEGKDDRDSARRWLDFAGASRPACRRRLGKRARRYLQRQHLLDLGAAALAYVTELTHRRPQIWIHDVERLHQLLQIHGDAAVRRAFERGLAEQAIGAEYIAQYLGDSSPSLPFDPGATGRRR